MVEIKLDQLPDDFSKDIYGQKCDMVYQHVYDSYYGPDRSIYAIAV